MATLLILHIKGKNLDILAPIFKENVGILVAYNKSTEMEYPISLENTFMIAQRLRR